MKVYVLAAERVHGGDAVEGDVLDVFSKEDDAVAAMRKAAENHVKCLKDTLGWNTEIKQNANTSITVYTDDGPAWDEFTIYEKEVK